MIETLEAERQRLRQQLAPIAERAPSVSILYLPSPQNIYIFDGSYALAAPIEDLGFTVHVPQSVELENGLGQLSTEVLPTLEADTVITLRFSGKDGQPAPHPADSLLELGSAEVLTHVLEPERPATGPLTDLAYLEAFAALLQETHAEEAP